MTIGSVATPYTASCSTVMPISGTTASRATPDMKISPGWNRSPDEASIAGSLWCTR